MARTGIIRLNAGARTPKTYRQPGRPTFEQGKPYRTNDEELLRWAEGIDFLTVAYAPSSDKNVAEEAAPAASEQPSAIPQPEVEKIGSEDGDQPLLTDIDGVGPARAKALIAAGFPTVDSVAAADPAHLRQSLKDQGASISESAAIDLVESASDLVDGEG